MGRPRKVPRETKLPALADQVAALLTERAQLIVRMAAIDKTLAGVRAALGMSDSQIHSDVKAPRDTAAELAHPNRDQARTDAILAALENAALSVREIAKELTQDRLIVKQALQRLKAKGVLTTIGQGPGTKYARVAVAPPDPPRAVASRPEPAVLRVHTVSKTDLASVEARDQTVLRYLRAHIATLEQLTKALPTERGLSEDEYTAALEASLTRLQAKRLIVRSGKAWTAAVVASTGTS